MNNYSITLVSFKNISWKSQIFNLPETFVFFKKFSILKSPFKYNKNREQFCIKKIRQKKFKNDISSKFYEIIFLKYLFLSNTKFFFFSKIELKKIW